MTFYPFALFYIGILLAIASLVSQLDGYKRTSRVLQVLAIIHVAPLIFLLWSSLLFGVR